MKNKEIQEFKKKVREAVANYMSSEGCSCCRDVDAHKINAEVLGILLNVEKYKDGSGRNFNKYKTQKP